MRASKVWLFKVATFVNVKNELKLPRVGFCYVAKKKSDLVYHVEVLSALEKFKYKVNFIDQGFVKSYQEKAAFCSLGTIERS